jgi:hypothetical protein
MTGSGGGTIADQIGGKFVQEVTAVSLAVEKLHPEVYSVIELGGQDAKIIVFKDDNESGRKKKIPSMNDKCAGGTGAVIDKINAKLKIPVEELPQLPYNGIKLHKVAGKCGVFAETDINGLQKEGTPPDELMASLFEAIILQNLSVLTRGHTLKPHVLLLGGPNTFIRGMREAWIANIPRMWKERKVEIPEGSTPDQLIKVPQNAQYFAALGAIEFGKDEDDEVGQYTGWATTTSNMGGLRRKPRRAVRVWSAPPMSSSPSKTYTAARNLHPPRFSAGRQWPDLSEWMAGLRRRKPRWSTRMATFSARPTSSRTVIRLKTPSRCSRSFARRWRIRARSSKCLGSEPPAMQRIS